MPSITTLAETLRDLAKPGMKPKELLAAVRDKHPNASKKEVVRAALYALTEGADGGSEQAKHLHDFAMTERGHDDDSLAPTAKARKKKHRKPTERTQVAH